MDNVGDSVNESVESSLHSKETKENTSPAELKKAWSIRVRTLVNLFVASLRWFLSLLFLKPVAYFKNSITMRRKKRSKDPKTARVFVINDLSSCDKLLLFHRSKYPVKMNYIGMDCEWVSKKGQVNAPVALLQIATPLCDCFLVRLCKMDGQMPQIVKEILEDKAVLKFGVGIQDDAKRLLEMFGIHARGCVDLRHVAQRIQWENGDQSCQKMSLDALAKRILGVKLNKSWSIQCGNWEEEKLSTQQVEYAMNDALVASHIFLMLVKEKARKSSDLDICNRDEGTNQSSAMITGKCHPDSSETCLNLEQSRENVEINLTGPEAAAGDNEHHDSPPSEFAENRNLNQEGKYQEKLDDENTKISCERSVVKGDGDLFPDFQICDKSFQSLASGADYYEATVDLSKFESDEMAGYFSRDKVTSLISDPYFTQRAGLLCQGVIDMAFKTRKRKVVLIDKDGNSLSPEKSLKPYKCGTTRKSPLYMNCMLTAPDGSRLCGVSREKADWYIDKGLGHKTNNDPYTVQLNFTPAKRPGTEDHCLNFYINRCVVCGAHESYMRKNIVPHDYRRHFPPEMKDHHSHDILLTCPRCHSLANFFDDHLRKELAIEYNAPLGNATDSRFKEDPVLRKVKAAARALSHPVKRKMKAKALSHPDERKMKADKQQKFSLIVQNHFGTSALTLEMIRHAATMETRKENANFKSHGLKVFERVHSEGKLLEFEEMWRKHFVDKMDPKFLPKSWSIDRPRESVKSKMGILISCSGGPYMQYTVNNFSA